MGDPRKPYGEVAWLWGIWCGVWENGRPVGICQSVWGDGLCGRPRNRMGNRKNVWEMPQGMGNGAGVWEAARLYGERKSYESQEWNNGIWPADFARFREFWREAAARHGGRRTAWRACPNGRLGVICGLCMFLQQRGAPLDWMALPLGWRQVAGALVPLGSVGVWQWRSFKAGTGPHGSGAATAPLQPAPDAPAAPLKGWPRRTVPGRFSIGSWADCGRRHGTRYRQGFAQGLLRMSRRLKFYVCAIWP